MQILMNSGGIAMTNCYLLADEQARQAVLFDAPDHTTDRLLDEVEARGWELIGLWLTHGHFDHLADHARVRQRFPNAELLIHRLDEPKLLQPNTSLFALPFTIPPGTADGYVADGQVLQLGSLRATVIHTPGHAPGHVMYHFESEQLLIGGDLIIAGSVGRTDLPDSDHQQLIRSIQRVMQLPGQTRLLPGHGEPSTLDHEHQTNPYVRQILQAG